MPPGLNGLAKPAPELTVVSPVYGCRGCLEELVDRVSAAAGTAVASCEILLVDDASPDDAWSRIEELAQTHPEVRGLRLSRNFGQHAAISAGLAHATGRMIVVMDCDLQDIPEEIPALLAALGQGVDVVLASRTERQDSILKKASSRTFYRLLGWLTGSVYDPTTANFGAYSRKVIDAVNAMPEADRFFPLLVRWTGFRSALVPVEHGRRTEGRSGYSLRQLLRLATNVALSFSDKPLRLVVKMGLGFAVLSLCIVAMAVFKYAAGDIAVAGFTSIIASIWLVGGAIVSSIGIVGLYVGKLHGQVKNRPNYIIAEDTGDRP
ncbi:glucosyl transferase [Luteimonas padinae]|uniref:Glycosyltransferase family 2 protein n=1 Tax=Luteimonas padinae TaxID=1714359 RepID=A0ABV6SX58_9GAMM|nr:glycosyltransferase family 2 protein [Luteimonas padinae]GHD71428.1 glucosyl transferase [Luteimonas padinae]